MAQLNAKEFLESGNRWTDRVARLALPVFLSAVRHGIERFTYADLAEALQRNNREPIKARKTLYGKPAGKIGEALAVLSAELQEDIPPINLMMVKKGLGRSGTGAYGFVYRYLHKRRKKKLTDAVRST